MAANEIILKLVIDGKEANATLNLTDNNIKELYKSFKYGKQEVNGLTTAISQGFNNAREIIQGFKEAYNVIASAFSTHLNAYREQEAALIKLNTALAQSNQLTDENVKSLTEYAQKLQQTTVYGDEVTETVMAQLLAMGLNIEQTKQATLQAANLATVMGTDLNTAARAMADLFQGNTGLIGRYIKGLDETIIKSGDLNKILSMLNERIGGQAEAIGQTSVGAIARMNNAIGDLKENTGQMLSQALGPFVNMIANIIGQLNTISPQLSGFIGLLGSITTAFITLRVTGILPAIKSIELFGVALTGLKAAFIKTGIGALVTALGYGFYELAKAYEKWQNIKSNGEQSFNNILDQIRSDALKAKKNELDWMLNDAEKQKEKILKDIEKLKNDIQKAKKEIVTKDKEGYEYKNYYDTEESKKLSEQLKQTEYLLKLEEEKIKIYTEVINQKQKVIKLSDEELKKEFDKNREILTEKQRHEAALLKITEDNELLELEQKKKHLNEMIQLYRQYGQDITQLINMLNETEIELKLKLKPPELELEQPEDIELTDIQYGNILEYARMSKQQEIELWYQTEQEKIKTYENSTEMLNALNEEYARRKAELDEEIANTTLEVYSNMFGALSLFFAKHTLAYKLFAIAQTLIDTYQSAQAAYKSLVSIPVVGPTLASIAAATAIAQGLARVNAISSVKVPGYQSGGRLRKGETGFIEGYENEIIAPERTFVEIFKQELRPQIYNNQVYDNRYDLLIEKLDNWQKEFTLRFDGYDFVTAIDKINLRKNKIQY
ncbi:hypothetical protein [Rosettibacter firmus]|uniref:hypothetical protein n=1 Tax=Rosettibacter firmus TaxID=3111522 RepID=UPI00336BF69F